MGRGIYRGWGRKQRDIEERLGVRKDEGIEEGSKHLLQRLDVEGGQGELEVGPQVLGDGK